MKPKTAMRLLKRNAWKLARAKALGTVRSYSGIGKKWKQWTREALK